MSGAKVAVISPPLTPIIVGGVVTIGGVLVAGYLVKKGAEYGYVKVKFERLKSDFRDYIKEIKLREDELKTKYNLVVNYSDKFEKFIDKTMQKYNTSIYKILSSEEVDRKEIQQRVSKIREECNRLRIELQEIEKELSIYNETIDTLEKSDKMRGEFENIVALHRSIKNQSTILKRKELLRELKEQIEQYETKSFELFMQNSSTQIEEELFIEEHKSQKIKREIVMVVEKIKIVESSYLFEFDIEQESSRLELIKDEVKVVYAKIKKSKLLKDKILDWVQGINNPDLDSKVSLFVSKVQVTQSEYKQLTQEIESYIADTKAKEQQELIVNNVIGGLKELGYEIVDEDIERLKAKEEVLIDIDEKYKLKVILVDNSYKIRFIKHLSSQTEPTQTEQQRDIEVMKKWCGDYDKLLQFLAQNGLAVEHKIKLEPDMDDIEYVVVESEEKGKQDVNGTIKVKGLTTDKILV
jgi:hypothetical protein